MGNLLESLTQAFRGAVLGAFTSLPPLKPIEVCSPLVTRVLGQNPGNFTLQGTNTYIVGNGKNRILIDTGSDGDSSIRYVKNLEKAMEICGCEGIQAIVITHWHHDHIGGVKSVLGFLENRRATFKKQQEVVPVYKFMPDVQEDLFEGQGSKDPYSLFPKDDICPLKNDQVLKSEGATLKIIYTPGHANDHVCLWLEEESSLFSGDNVLGFGTGVFKDLTSYMNSLEKMNHFNPKTIYPGHGSVMNGNTAATKILDYINHRKKRIDQVKQCLVDHSKQSDDAGIDSMSITKSIYTHVPKQLLLPAQWNTEKVLDHLVDIEFCKRFDQDNATLYRLNENNAQKQLNKL